MIKVGIIGGGVIGAAIAYQLSLNPQLKVTLWEQDRQVATGATGAALGILVGVVSQKLRGKAWELRDRTLKRYQTLLPELEALTCQKIPYNTQGIVKLIPASEPKPEQWENLIKSRRSQGWELEWWDSHQLTVKCPHIARENLLGAVYSPQDLQINPVSLTEALIAGARLNGAECHFGIKVQKIMNEPLRGDSNQKLAQVLTDLGDWEGDFLVIAAGLGTTPLTEQLKQTVDIRPVLGQALHFHLNYSLGNPDFQPIITRNDVHIVPIGGGDYWVGATVEFPNEEGEIIADPSLLEGLKREAIAFCPQLEQGEIINTWSGQRPRPHDRPAPIIEQLKSHPNILLATGHYRNGILLAPVTALAIQEMITNILNSS